jgi:hypothetical protein
MNGVATEQVRPMVAYASAIGLRSPLPGFAPTDGDDLSVSAFDDAMSHRKAMRW